MSSPPFVELIEKKRDGHALSEEEIKRWISQLPVLPDYQVSAMLMAVFLRGMTVAETRTLTLSMRDSGDKLEFTGDAADPRPLVDKHSTGGVGDKVSLPLAPLLACLGFRVPMISGRGLSITGGTLDKLDSIPGFNTSLAAADLMSVVNCVGCAISGQTGNMVPADKTLYALRDVTGTVPSIPLITASILSKKLAEGIGALVLDVKYGCAAFMKTRAEADELAKALADLSAETGVPCTAILSGMDTPLGRSAGNWLEVKESVAILENKADAADLRELILESAAHLLVLTRKAKTHQEARQEAEECLLSGKPRAKWDEMVAAQGGHLEAMNAKLAMDTTAALVHEIKAERAGYITGSNARILGEVVRDLGGGRVCKESVLDFDVGLDRLAKIGEQVAVGDVLCRMHLRNQAQAEALGSKTLSAFTIEDSAPPSANLIVGVVQGRAST